MNKYPAIYKEIIITDLNDILNKIKEYKNLEFFRGQSRSSWKLFPKIKRYFSNHPPDTWSNLESFMIQEFRQYSIPYIEKELNNIEMLVLSQHYGLPTRLLDWTTNPLKAIFFAVSTDFNIDGALFGLQPTSFLDYIDRSLVLNELQNFYAIYPNMIDKRIIAQEGCFTLFPFPKNKSRFKSLEDSKFYEDEYYLLVKMKIPKTKKIQILKDLNMFGIQHRSLFPDLEGLSKYIAWKFKYIN